jgi:transposase
MYRTKVGVDLAKKVIQVCIYRDKKVLSNEEMTPDEFLCWLINAKPATIIFEACGTSNYWMQRAIEAGHDARLISAKLVSTVRQNQKTDKNDALAIIQAALLPDINFISGKSVEQQQLQSIQRLRELAIKQRDATRKQIIALLLELNFRSPNSVAGMIRKIDDIVEDGENGLSAALRQALNAAKEQFECMVKAIATHDKCLEQSIQTHHDCKKLLKLEGVGPINAVNLYISLGCAELGTFSKGKDASACIGLTPIQHTSGGKVKLGTIGKQCRNSMLRAQLIGGAMSVVRQVVKREAKTKKEMWLKALAERRGNKCAAVALANKTVRTAFAMLTQGTEYQAELLTA